MDYEQIESSQRQFNETLEHESRFRAAQIQEEMAIVSMLHPKITKDGNQWCVLYGDNLQEGIAGFGNTPGDAIRDFNCAFNKQ